MKKQSKSAGKLTPLENSRQIVAELEAIQSRIRQRAFEISLARGHMGRELDDWLSAESEIISAPPVEVVERQDSYSVRAAVPGVPLEDLEVMASGNQLLIKAELRHDHPEHGVTVHVCDFRPGIVFRSIEFPQPIDLKTMELECRDGVLQIRAYKEGAVRASQPKKPAGEKRTKASVSLRAAKAKA